MKNFLRRLLKRKKENKMICKGNFKFKSITKRDGGDFINEMGERIKYKPCFSLKCDELTDKGIFERTFKLPLDSKLISIFSDMEPYTDIELTFDVVIYGNRISVTPTMVNY